MHEFIKNVIINTCFKIIRLQPHRFIIHLIIVLHHLFLQAFPMDGIIDTVEIYAHVTGRPLRVGIYRPQSKNSCDYMLIQQITLDNFKKGPNKVKDFYISFCATAC